ncbi:hypothetical protein O976_01925 [Mycobacterium avium subsp. paratuberculosis 10-8425]|uniref:DUF732 domain-containing protein n=2 Tax=Mycobacterium avium TaxID=1764 RepID=Q73UA7_MYCPA|nr:hypothetical protein MAP_3461 [Mycobacterium avium subsp. paratuberculosis K-10]ETB01069.1 hypothetical protein O982_02085 [Mycobacterium avium 10-5581]ETB07952.1 hypothetical protein O978_01725 [Mycobacterium avium subsp. paratuberculosis 10-5864]ETB14717.1 hypothetical protein O980_01755 [Mycobacterium avium subsp. paratuberculosis 08-8281]ETB15362.1 hypothetical protein P863_02040 [Mycobacterium avium subsp. silvaticum ATCC 49884]ETB24073.1 hypothetical protein O973_01555 [Mycobacterium 
MRTFIPPCRKRDSDGSEFVGRDSSAVGALQADGEAGVKALARTHQWIWVLRHQPFTIRLLAAAAGLLTVASAFAAPAGAEGNGDDFIDALNHAGIDFGEPGNAMAVGESVCPMLSQPGGNFAAVASSVAGRGMSPTMARMFTTIAIQTYCPQEMANIASGNLSGAMPQVPGMPGQLPAMAGQIPGMAGQTGQLPTMPGQLPSF